MLHEQCTSKIQWWLYACCARTAMLCTAHTRLSMALSTRFVRPLVTRRNTLDVCSVRHHTDSSARISHTHILTRRSSTAHAAHHASSHLQGRFGRQQFCAERSRYHDNAMQSDYGSNKEDTKLFYIPGGINSFRVNAHNQKLLRAEISPKKSTNFQAQLQQLQVRGSNACI